MDDEGEERAERFDVVFFIQVHRLEAFELTVAVAIFLDLGEFGLELAHELGLVELTLDEWPHTKFDQNDEEDDGEAEVTNVVIDEKEDVGDGADNYEINSCKHILFIVTYFLQIENG